MDNHVHKLNIVLDLIEHPEKYTAHQLEEILSDSETRDIYNLICKTKSAIDANRDNDLDVDEEWKRFSAAHPVHRLSPILFFLRRPASIIAIILSSIMALAAGLAIKVAVSDHTGRFESNEDLSVFEALAVSSDTITVKSDQNETTSSPIIFEDVPLETIMNRIAIVYGVKINFHDKEAASLHLYYKFDPSLPLGEVLEQLNTFEQINITHSDDTLNIN